METSHVILPRYASDAGETLIVKDLFGINALVDPTDDTVAVIVPAGRRADLIRFGNCPHSRDFRTIVATVNSCLGFAPVQCPEFIVFLQDLSEGQLVDILPAADAAPVYAALLSPVPVLYGAVAVQPDYVLVA